MTDAIKGLEEIFQEVMPPEMVEAFVSGYKNPTYDRISSECHRCSAVVKSQTLHNSYHRNLTLSIWLLQGWSLAHMRDDHNEELDLTNYDEA